jgi:hypothetical protein
LSQFVGVRRAVVRAAGPAPSGADAIAFVVNNRQPKASGATMDEHEFETDGTQDAPSGGAPAGFHETADTADTADYAVTTDTAAFYVDYEHSGDRRVDDALDRLARLPDTPLPGHAEVYDTVHTELRAILADQPGQPAGAQGPR